MVPGGGLGRSVGRTRSTKFRERLVVSGLPDATGYRPCRALVGSSVGDVRCFLARIKPKNDLRRTLSRERGLARQDRIVRRNGKVRRACHGAALRAAMGCLGQRRPWTALRGGAALQLSRYDGTPVCFERLSRPQLNSTAYTDGKIPRRRVGRWFFSNSEAKANPRKNAH